jgi:hypothetical protein
MARLLTRPSLADTSPARPESAKTASSPRDAPCPKQGHSFAADPRFTFHASRFTAPGSDARTKLADVFSILQPALFMTVRREIAEPRRETCARSPEDPMRTRAVR